MTLRLHYRMLSIRSYIHIHLDGRARGLLVNRTCSWIGIATGVRVAWTVTIHPILVETLVGTCERVARASGGTSEKGHEQEGAHGFFE